MPQLLCQFPARSASYTLQIQNGLLDSSGWVQSAAQFGRRFAIIADENVASTYGAQVRNTLQQCGFEPFLFSFPAGESSKTRQTKEQLEDCLFNASLGRDTCIIAVGGGVTTDLAGYIAATFCRGIPLVMIPTTLLAMVDACIGGKNGLNTPHGKNLIGSFYQPSLVLIDPHTLKSLPIKELQYGAMEMVKHGLIADEKYVQRLKTEAVNFFSLDPATVERAISTSCRIKLDIVQQDEQEKGKRRLLNFGHTVGHALEKVANYSMPHGEAVGIGIAVESYLSMLVGYMQPRIFDDVCEVLVAYGHSLKKTFPVCPNAMLHAMARDKKSVREMPRFVLLESFGKPLPFAGEYCSPVDENLVKKALEWMEKCFA